MFGITTHNSWNTCKEKNVGLKVDMASLGVTCQKCWGIETYFSLQDLLLVWTLFKSVSVATSGESSKIFSPMSR